MTVFRKFYLQASQPGRGVRYADLYYSYQIMICNRKVFNWDNRLVENFNYRSEQGRFLSDITTAIFVDLSQVGSLLKKPVAEMTAVEQWVVFLAKANDPKYQNVINEILKRKEGISVAYETLTSISTDENERARFRSRRMWQMDREHEIAQAKYEVRLEYEPKLAQKDAIIAELRAKLEGSN